MSKFLDTEQLTIGVFLDPTTGKRTWVTSRAFGYQLGDDGALPALIVVPAYTETDLGSIPPWLRWVFTGHSPNAARAYVLHDYVNSLTAHRPPGEGVWSSQVAAAVLYEALRLDGEPVWSCIVQTAGVFLGIAAKER